MKAIVIDTYGGPERMQLRELPDPHPKAGEVVIDVVCAGVNPVDWKIREGALRSYYDWPLPLVLGCDVAGRVAALGAGVGGWAVGDRVYACTFPVVPRSGAFAEKVAVPANAVAPMPKRMDFAAAAGVPLAALTAWQCFYGTAGIKPGDKVLVHAAAGGVGSFAVPIAKAAGAFVVGTASAGNAAYVKSLGADAVIDYRSEDVVQAARRLAPGGFDIVLAATAGEALARSAEVAKRGGIVVSITAAPNETDAKARGVRSAWVGMEANGRELALIGTMIDAGQIDAAPTEVFPLAQAARALEVSKTGRVRGKLVLSVG
jgi:NADPH2:quinone reductase